MGAALADRGQARAPIELPLARPPVTPNAICPHGKLTVNRQLSRIRFAWQWGNLVGVIHVVHPLESFLHRGLVVGHLFTIFGDHIPAIGENDLTVAVVVAPTGVIPELVGLSITRPFRELS